MKSWSLKYYSHETVICKWLANKADELQRAMQTCKEPCGHASLLRKAALKAGGKFRHFIVIHHYVSMAFLAGNYREKG